MKKMIFVVFWGHHSDGRIEPFTDEDGRVRQFDTHEEAFEAVRDHPLEAYAENVAVRK